MAMVNRFEVYLINLDAKVSADPKNTRPAVIISPDEMNRHLGHVVVAPISSTTARFPTRIPTEFLNSERFVLLDRLRSVENTRLVKKIGEIDKKTAGRIIQILNEMFAE